MPFGLSEHAFAGIHQDDGQLRIGSTRRHVPRVLFVAGRIGDDEFAFGRAEITVGDIDRDALFPLGGKTIHQQRQVDVLALSPLFAAVCFQRIQLILEDQLGVIQQSADQRALAVVHAAAGDEFQHALRAFHVDELLHVGACFVIGGHQK